MVRGRRRRRVHRRWWPGRGMIEAAVEAGEGKWGNRR